LFSRLYNSVVGSRDDYAPLHGKSTTYWIDNIGDYYMYPGGAKPYAKELYSVYNYLGWSI